MLLVCLNQDSNTGRAVAESGVYAVNVLTDEQAEIAEHFAVKGPDKFAALKTEKGVWGEPLLAGALATIECRVVEKVVGGTHVVFIAMVEKAEVGWGAPLAYFRGAFGRLEVAG
jgi:flavin reductase (DIM6/NTAB) family NADH-FMN oxidoreductase RutF